MTIAKRLDIRDLPRDPQGCLRRLRKELCNTHNYVRTNEDKYDIMLEVIEYTLKHMKEEKKAHKKHMGKVSKPIKQSKEG